MSTWENQPLFPNPDEDRDWGGYNPQQPAEFDLTAIEKIVVVTRKTPLEELIHRQNSKSQARFYLEQNNVSFAEYERADVQYQQALQTVRRQLPGKLKTQFLDRELLSTYQFGERDLVVTL